MSRSPYRRKVFLAPTNLTTAQRQLLINVFSRPPREDLESLAEACDIELRTILDMHAEPEHQNYCDAVETAYWDALGDVAAMLDVQPDEPDELREILDFISHPRRYGDEDE